MRSKLLLPAALVALLITPAVASAAFVHVVGAGESLYSVAAADGLSVTDLAVANGLSPDSQLTSGQALQIPPQGAAVPGPASAAPVPASAPAGRDYLVQPGDTLSAIAAAHGLTVEQLASANGVDPAGVLVSGTTISVPGASASATSDAVSASATPVPADAAQPTAESVSARQIGTIAAANGVSPSLAEAIGWQESGFNNGLVSRTGATGVMQIEPGTWNWIGQNLVSPPPLSNLSATDNIRGGVLLLRSLLGQTGGDPSLAAAGYYQGLESVRRHGMYADTQRYVDDVMALRSRFGGP